MDFSEIRQTMTDDACDIISALCQSSTLTLQAIAFITGAEEYATRFILEQMTVMEVATEHNGLWQLTEAFKASACSC